MKHEHELMSMVAEICGLSQEHSSSSPSPRGFYKLSAKERRLRKSAIRAFRKDRVVDDPAKWVSGLFVFALWILGRPDFDKAARIARARPEDRDRFVRNLREARMVHHDRLDLSESWSDDSKPGMMVFGLVLQALAAEGLELDVWQPCPHCDKSARRAGYDSAGVQRWECSECKTPSGRPVRFCYSGNSLERMRAGPTKLRKALYLARKGWKPEGISQQSGLSIGQARKVKALAAEDPELEISGKDTWYSAMPGQTGKRTSQWRPVKWNIYQRK